MDYLYCEYLLSSAVVSGIRLNQVRSLFHLSPLLDLSRYYELFSNIPSTSSVPSVPGRSANKFWGPVVGLHEFPVVILRERNYFGQEVTVSNALG